MKSPLHSKILASLGLGLGGCLLASGTNAIAQEAVQWRVEDGGNGHWYAAVETVSDESTTLNYVASIGASPAACTSATITVSASLKQVQKSSNKSIKRL